MQAQQAPALRREAPGEAPDGMVWIPGGEFSMGAVDSPHLGAVEREALRDARPVHRVAVDGFWMDTTEVTNARFAEFVEATGYVTVAERAPTPEELPGVPPEALVAGSVVFSPPPGPVPLDQPYSWWRYQEGADWRHPRGPGSDLRGLESHPVVHVAYADAEAFARWAGRRLPTEAEFERAARGGLEGNPYPWGDELRPQGRVMANTFQGTFPYEDRAEDGYAGTAPVGSFPANGFGLFDMAGNAWEWVSDWYRPDTYARRGPLTVNPTGPDSSWDPLEPGARKRVLRGGSYLCTDQYCARYRVGTRGKGEISTGSDHVGFRTVLSP